MRLTKMSHDVRPDITMLPVIKIFMKAVESILLETGDESPLLPRLLPRLPRCLPFGPHLIQHIVFREGIHRLPKPIVIISHHLAVLVNVAREPARTSPISQFSTYLKISRLATKKPPFMRPSVTCSFSLKFTNFARWPHPFHQIVPADAPP